MSSRNDWMLEAIDEVARAAESAHQAIAVVAEVVESTRARRQSGETIDRIFDDLVTQGGRRKRVRAGAALDDFERAILAYRAGLVRAMVDEHGATFSELARRMEVSRQMVARLYRTKTAEPKVVARV
jgi:hypothetical protein